MTVECLFRRHLEYEVQLVNEYQRASERYGGGARVMGCMPHLSRHVDGTAHHLVRLGRPPVFL